MTTPTGAPSRKCSPRRALSATTFPRAPSPSARREPAGATVRLRQQLANVLQRRAGPNPRNDTVDAWAARHGRRAVGCRAAPRVRGACSAPRAGAARGTGWGPTRSGAAVDHSPWADIGLGETRAGREVERSGDERELRAVALPRTGGAFRGRAAVGEREAAFACRHDPVVRDRDPNTDRLAAVFGLDRAPVQPIASPSGLK